MCLTPPRHFVRGKVIAGITGCSRYKDDVCFITGHDAATGKELWRTSTVARPGEPGGDTWGDLPLTFGCLMFCNEIDHGRNDCGGDDPLGRIAPVNR